MPIGNAKRIRDARGRNFRHATLELAFSEPEIDSINEGTAPCRDVIDPSNGENWFQRSSIALLASFVRSGMNERPSTSNASYIGEKEVLD